MVPLLAVAYLLRKGNDPKLLIDFIDSYVNHDPGHEHDLIIIFKGFDKHSIELSSEYSALRKVPYIAYHTSDHGFDIHAYRRTARHFNKYITFCFLNSYSKILCDDWLVNMYRALSSSGVELVGCSGSYMSINSDNREFPMKNIKSLAWHVLSRTLFPEFPNPHIRTNAFMIRRDIFLNLIMPPPIHKIAAWMFESGRDSMTRQIESSGSKVAVVDNKGEVYYRQWMDSKTFWISNQEGLAISDNQSEMYMKASDSERRNITRRSFG